jgi:hypothetical protein
MAALPIPTIMINTPNASTTYPVMLIKSKKLVLFIFGYSSIKGIWM